MEKRLQEVLEKRFHKTLDTCTKEELFHALMEITKEATGNLKRNEGSKKLYYISAEFLIGKLLSNNLINLGLYEETEKVLKSHGYELCEIEELEMEPSLGNGGLGRLAACFLDSIATLGLPGDGIGLNYHFGLFQQKFTNHKQQELKNPWITKESWLNRQSFTCKVPFKDFTMDGVLYDIDVPGYDSGCNRLHLFDVDTIDESIVPENSINFNKKKVQENLTLFLYPDDSDDAGRKLRIYQQYFMVSCGAQLILKEMEDAGYDLHELNNHAVIQINDTHPSMVIPELIRLLTEEKGFTMDEAVEVVSKTCAYTNHTILAEALEKWPMEYLEEVVPNLVPIIKELDERVRKTVKDESTYIIDAQDRVHMAHMDIHYGFSVNGVAALHTEILKNSELKNFYDLYPERFNNKTNGITFRRWLMHCNPILTRYIESLIGNGFKKDATELEKLLAFENDETVLNKLEEIKMEKKLEFKEYMEETQRLTIDEHSIIDVQVKRLHEYKRQQMNALYAIYKYLDIKAGNKPSTPITMIFGAKAAPAYVIAKDIIHLILCLQELIEKDPEVRPYFRVLMIENYNVSKAAKVIPAANISEQISLASKEASGTGNMKFMLNGAPTLGTMDGANVEIVEEVGKENAFIFGLSSDEVMNYEKNGGYDPYEIYNNDPDVRRVVDQLVDGTYADGDRERYRDLYNSLLKSNGFDKADMYFILKDFRSYANAQEEVEKAYRDKDRWAKMALLNTASCGKFSSDRTIQEYVDDIWKLDKLV